MHITNQREKKDDNELPLHSFGFFPQNWKKKKNLQSTIKLSERSLDQIIKSAYEGGPTSITCTNQRQNKKNHFFKLITHNYG
jgi:predicted adenine nucleotide alpha hydrolase (AANH) superfamily ATPase